MSSGSPKRSKASRVAALPLPPGQFARLAGYLRRGDVLLRLGLCLLAAMVMWAVTSAWAPPFPFRSGYVPPRDVVARVAFTRPDPAKTEDIRKQLIAGTLCIYKHDVQPLVELRQALKDQVFQIVRSTAFDEVDKEVWDRFAPPAAEGVPPIDSTPLYDAFRAALAKDKELASFERAVRLALEPFERHGLLESLGHQLTEGSQTAIMVHPIGNERMLKRVEVEEVRIAEVTSDLLQRLEREFRAAKLPEEHVATVARLVHNWIMANKLPSTLTINREATARAHAAAVENAPEATHNYVPGERLAAGAKPLTKDDVELLRREHRAVLQQLSYAKMLRHSLADLGMYVAMYVLCGVYIFYHEPRLFRSLRRFSMMLGLAALTVAACVIASRDDWRAEVIPLVLFGLTVAIAYHRELALLLSTTVALVVALSLGQSLAEFVILVAAAAAAVLMLGRIRSRTRLIYVGCGAGLAALLTTVGVGTMVGQAFGASDMPEWLARLEWIDEAHFVSRVMAGGAWYGFCAVLAGFLITGLLPFIERSFDVQTDISLLELGDAAHPLLQELARRAPGTYNHSINVASLGEAAAEAIGANGLLVRVGAYFHDIGKMLKPGYFVENQGPTSRHESLLPAMSTLVIIAHVKDGADLARQHHLPRSVIDFIEQHHGTTLVEYFYRQATKQHEEDPDTSEVDETNFRYPGPKPQTREAGVMMLSDAVESAARTLVDPAPARIESLVHEMAMKRLLDGQFDECGLTLSELHVIEDSLVKSLTAVYHGRVKYPSQQTA